MKTIHLLPFALLPLAAGCKSTSDTHAEPASAPKSAVTAGSAGPSRPGAAAATAGPTAPAMAPSSTILATPVGRAELGAPAPGFELKDIDGKSVKLSQFKGRKVVLEWFNPSCPYCVYVYGEKGPLRQLPDQLVRNGVVWLSIVSEKPENPGRKTETIRKFMEANGIETPMLLDPTGTVGRAYGAKTTPHVFVINDKGTLVYAGALDNAPMGKVADGGTLVNYVEAAVADLRAGRSVTTSGTKPYG